MAANDPSFGSVALLLPMDDTGLSDAKGHTITKVGNAVRSGAQSKFGGYSAYFDGSGDYLSVPASAEWFFGTDAFTIECWVYIAANSATDGGGLRNAQLWTTMSANLGGFGFQVLGNASTTGTGIGWEDKYGGSNIGGNWATTVSQGAWHHVAVCREAAGANLYLALDGTVSASAIAGGASRSLGASAYAAQIGGQPLVTNWYRYLNGYLDDFRITRGVARYTTNYTPPASSHPLYGRYVGGSLTEDSQHTEFRVRAHRLDSGAMLNEMIASGSSYEIPCCPVVAPYTDYSGPVMIACFPRMSGVWVATTAKAVGDYAIPTDPVTKPYVYKVTATGIADSASGNVKLLMHMEGTDDSTTGFVDMTGKAVTPAGNVKHESTQKKFGSTSVYFDGAGDYLSITDSSLNVSTGDFTAECWVYVTAMTAVQGVFFWGNPASNANRIQLDFKTDGSVSLYMEDGATQWSGVTTGIGTITANAWHHVAIVRNGSTLRVFVDGIKVGGDATQTITVSAGATLYLGTARNGGVQRYLTGYLDEVRVTIGTARYTGDFTPPSAPFPYGTGPTEPEWPTTAGATVNDGDLSWTCVDRMLQPILHGPLIPRI